jgi:hypothetical protein
MPSLRVAKNLMWAKLHVRIEQRAMQVLLSKSSQSWTESPLTGELTTWSWVMRKWDVL